MENKKLINYAIILSGAIVLYLVLRKKKSSDQIKTSDTDSQAEKPLTDTDSLRQTISKVIEKQDGIRDANENERMVDDVMYKFEQSGLLNSKEDTVSANKFFQSVLKYGKLLPQRIKDEAIVLGNKYPIILDMQNNIFSKDSNGKMSRFKLAIKG